jgi:hypothetical protein
MTTERVTVRRTVVAGLCAVLAWFGGVAGWTALEQPRGLLLVIGPPRMVLSAAAGSGAALVEVHAHASIVAGQQRGLVRALYANGAWFVLPAMEGGCSALAARY